MKSKVTARIRQAKDDEGTDALWLFVDRNDTHSSADDIKNILGVTDRTEDEGNVAYPVLKSELKPIRDAIDEYLKQKD